MSHDATSADLYFQNNGLDADIAAGLIAEALKGADDGELFLEYRQSESISLDDGKIKSANFDTSMGFGLRAVSGEATGFAHASEFSEGALKRAADTVKAVRSGHGGEAAVGPSGTNIQLYTDANPIGLLPFETKVELLQKIDAYA